MSYYGRSDTTQRVVLVGLVALVLGLVLGAGAGFGGGLLTQRQAPSHSGGGVAPPAPPAAATSIPGATGVVNGIGVGFSHDETGAVQAARQVATLEYSPAALDDARWAAVRRQILAQGSPYKSDPPTFRQVTEQLFGWPAGRVPDGGLFTDTPVAWKTILYAPGTAKIGIWSVVVGGSPSTSRFRELWIGVNYVMRWERGDWRLWDGTGDWSMQPVPLPIQPATPEQGLPAELRGFRAF